MKSNKRDEAITSLRKSLKKGDTLYTVLRSVSASGMSRTLDVYHVKDGEILRLTWSVAQALECTYCRKREALKVVGCGMDMGFDVVYSLSCTLFNEGDALHHRWL